MYGCGSVYRFVYTCWSHCELGLKELLGSGSSLRFCFFSLQGIKVLAVILGSTTHFGWPSVFSLCHRAGSGLRSELLEPPTLRAGVASLSLREATEPRELRNYLESGKNNAERPKMRHPHSMAIGNTLAKAWRITGATGKPAGTSLGLLENSGWAPPSDGMGAEQPPLPKPAPATAGASLNPSIPGRRFSTGHPHLHETLGKLISLSCSVWFNLLQLTPVTVTAPAPQKCCG